MAASKAAGLLICFYKIAVSLAGGGYFVFIKKTTSVLNIITVCPLGIKDKVSNILIGFHLLIGD
jgi:hypothetical protein